MSIWLDVVNASLSRCLIHYPAPIKYTDHLRYSSLCSSPVHFGPVRISPVLSIQHCVTPFRASKTLIAENATHAVPTTEFTKRKAPREEEKYEETPRASKPRIM